MPKQQYTSVNISRSLVMEIRDQHGQHTNISSWVREAVEEKLRREKGGHGE